MRPKPAYAHYLPSAPYRLRASFFVHRALAFALIALMVALAVYCVWSSLRGTQSILRERRIWQAGTPSSWAAFEGTHTARKIIFHEYVLDVTYEGPGEQPITGRLHVDTLGSSLDSNAPIEVRFIPDHPEQFALNLALDVSGGRWATIVTFGVFGVLLFFACGFVLVMQLRNFLGVLRAARNGVLEEAFSLAPPEFDQHGNKTFKFRLEDDGEQVHSESFSRKRHPFVLGENPLRFLALRSSEAPTVATLLRADMYPLSFSQDEVERFTESLAARRP